VVRWNYVAVMNVACTLMSHAKCRVPKCLVPKCRVPLATNATNVATATATATATANLA
jgi:hypothetical protein